MRNVLTVVLALSAGFVGGAIRSPNVAQVAPPPVPQWVADLCGDASPCLGLPTFAFEGGVMIGAQWNDDTGECLPALPPEHPSANCGANPYVAHWVVFTNGNPPADHLVGVASTAGGSTPAPAAAGKLMLAGPPPPMSVPPGLSTLGLVVGFGLPGAPAPQVPALPVLDATAWATWFDASFAAACALSPTCSSAGSQLSQAEFDAMLAASPYATHVQPFSFTVNGQTIAGTTGVPQ